MPKDFHTLSMVGGKYGYDDFDEDAKKLNMNRSQLLQFIYAQWKDKKKRDVKLVEIIMLILLAIIVLEILLVV